MRAFSDRKTLLAAIVFVTAIVVYPLLAPDSYHLGIGITAGASCPNNLIEDAILRLYELHGIDKAQLLA